MNTRNQKAQIFLSYAHEDIAMAKRIYQDLKRYGLDVWIDCEDLLPGQKWTIDIERNIKRSQYYLLLLSSYSMTKSGFIQKEMKIAYEVFENFSADDIYLILVRLNECELFYKRSDIHYIDVFPETEYQNGLKKIIQVVNSGTIVLRNESMELSTFDVNAMIVKSGFFEKNRNPSGKGFSHKYQFQEISGYKVVYDENSRLMWQQSGSDGRMESEDANKYINELNKKRYAGFSDWRLPKLEEAMGLMEAEKKNRLYIDPIFDGKQDWIWTADHNQLQGASLQWVVNFMKGHCYFYLLNCGTNYVRAVRFGHSDLDY